MAQPPPRCEHEAGRQGAEFLPRKLASGMVLGTLTLGTQELPLQGELALDVWFAEASSERAAGHMPMSSLGRFSAFRLGITYPPTAYYGVGPATLRG